MREMKSATDRMRERAERAERERDEARMKLKRVRALAAKAHEERVLVFALSVLAILDDEQEGRT